MANIQHKDLTGSALHEPKGIDVATANTVYLADGLGSGSWSVIPATSLSSIGQPDRQMLYSDGLGGTVWDSAPGGTFGSMTIDNNNTPQTLVGTNQWTKVTVGLTGAHLSNVVFSTDHLVVPFTGVYNFGGSITFSGATNDTFSFAVSLDGVTPLNSAHIVRQKTPNTDIRTIPYSSIHEFNAGESMYFIVKNETSSANPTFNQLTLTTILLRKDA